MNTYELKLGSGQIVVWDGIDGEDAAQRYADAHPGAVVIAWRDSHRRGLHIGLKPIVEAGDK